MWLINRPQHILSFLEANFPATTSEFVSELFIQIPCILYRMHGVYRLGWISKRWNVGIWTGLGWPRIETGGRRL